ncbi:hypothetical protein HDU98_008007 [Podochytrium sp. JEL0797]|nr:hypothetical protein HDU98_008007 [Podochytrium sp. JEL0797]
MATSLKEGFTMLATKPVLFVRQPAFLAVFLVYSGTYVTANSVESVCLNAKMDPTMPKFLSSTIVNISLCVWKDRKLAGWFGQGPARPFPRISYGLFTVRDSLTVAAAFTLPPIISKVLQGPEIGASKAFSDTLCQLGLPCAVQLVSTPIHLWGLNIYNRPHASVVERVGMNASLFASFLVPCESDETALGAAIEARLEELRVIPSNASRPNLHQIVDSQAGFREKVEEEVTQWMAEVFRYAPLYRTATFVCMGPNPSLISSSAIPVFYIPSSLPASHPDHPEKLIKKFWPLIGLPCYSPSPKIRKIPSTGPDSEAMDIDTLVAYLSEDAAVGRRPCLVYSRAGALGGVTGEWDDLARIREACSRFGCWMHVECDNMSLLTPPSPQDVSDPPTPDPLRSADSIAFHPSSAFKLVHSDLPAVTFFNTVDPRVMDPLHMDAFDATQEMGNSLTAQRRKSGGSAGGALISAALWVCL